MLSYFNKFPGIVHFMFVERLSNQVIAPIIIPLHGKQSMNNDVAEKYSISLITEKVRSMCFSAQEYLSKGYSTAIVKMGDFQYFYRLWIEDSEGNEIAFDSPLPTLSRPLDNSYYKDLIRKHYPRGVKCYELYALYLGILPVKTVVNHTRSLITHLKENEVNT